MRRLVARIPRTLSVLLSGSLAVLAVGGCALKHPTANLVAGKELFVAKCGACHTLAHANTTGIRGPNLDDAFRQDRADGIGGHAIEGLVAFWIQYPNTAGIMPPKLYSGQDAQNVAAYVALVAAAPGHDTGQLAAAGAVSGTTPADGKIVFQNNGCSSCHTLAAAGATGTVGPNLDQRLRSDCALPESMRIRGTTLAKCIHTAITDPYAYIPSGYSAGVMPATFAKTLKPSEIQALVNFLSAEAK